MNSCCLVNDEVDTDEDDNMSLRQLKDRHKKHGDDDEVGSDEDDKMPLSLLKGRHQKHGDDEVGSGAYDKMTLGKLKDMCKSKKRKLTSHPDTNRKHEDVNFQSDEDDDLKAHLSFSKSKFSKSLKAKHRCINRRLFALPKTVMSVKTEQVLVSDVPMQLKEDSPLFSNTKAEIPKPEFSVSQSSNLLVDSSSSEVPMLLKENSLPPVKVKTETFESESFGQKSTEAFTGHSSVGRHEGSISDEVISSEVSEIVERKYTASKLGEEQQCCMLNEMSYEHLEDFDPEYSPKSRGDMHANNPKKSFETEVDTQLHPHGGLLETISPARDKILDMHSHQHEFAEQSNCLGSEVDTQLHPHGGLLETISPARDKILDMHSHQHEFAEQSNCLGSYVSDTIIANKDGFTNNYDGDDIYMSQDEVTCTNLGSHVSDIVLANKVGCTNCSMVSPFKKCTASGDSQSCSNTDNNLESVEGTTTYEYSHSCSNGCLDKKSKVYAKVHQAKVFIGPNETAKRLKKRRHGSPPDHNLERHHLSQSRSQFTTDFTSIQHFSASAIAFSERQMHDTESLANKLMKELKSMKDMVEGQLEFKACSRASLNNEHKVRVAIQNANKVEKKARERLYSMNRNCTRFCKLMKISQDGAAPSKDTVHKARKITFADEAGGMLCHVNYFSNDMTSKQSDDGKQEA